MALLYQCRRAVGMTPVTTSTVAVHCSYSRLNACRQYRNLWQKRNIEQQQQKHLINITLFVFMYIHYY